MAQATEKQRVPRQIDAERTRESLLRSGTELFALQGFDGVTVEDIARKAGVNKALISYHFRGKRGLYRSILQSTLETGVARLRGLPEDPRSPADLLREFMAEFHRLATVDRPHFPALLLREVLAAGKAFDEHIAPEVTALFQIVRAIIERGIRAGVFRPVDPFLAHLTLMGSLVFFYATEPARQRLVREKRLPVTLPSMEEFLAHIQEMVIRGLAADARPQDRES